MGNILINEYIHKKIVFLQANTIKFIILNQVNTNRYYRQILQIYIIGLKGLITLLFIKM